MNDDVTDEMIEAGLEASRGDDGRSHYLFIDGDMGACLTSAGAEAIFKAMLQAKIAAEAEAKGGMRDK